jgi:hypothetical protein
MDGAGAPGHDPGGYGPAGRCPGWLVRQVGTFGTGRAVAPLVASTVEARYALLVAAQSGG